MTKELESRRSFKELAQLLEELEERYLGPDWAVLSDADSAEGIRFVMHLLEGALFSHFESDPDRPEFRRIVSPTRKFTGDNPDAVYFDCPVNPTATYRIRGNLAGAVYTSFTVEAGADEGRWGTRTAGILRDDDFEAAEDGSYEIIVGGPSRQGPWLELPPEASHLTTRHYFERTSPAAADPLLHIPLTIERVPPLGPPPAWDDASVGAAVRRVINNLRGKTLDQPRPSERRLPEWSASTPNVFPRPQRPGDHVLAAYDAHYSSAPFQLAEDEALVITGRWPRCRFANVVVWNRFGQTLDYVSRRVSLNRATTELEPDGSFRMVLAARDPGVANWIDTEGHSTGSVFWRFFLAEEPVETPLTEVISVTKLTQGAG